VYTATAVLLSVCKRTKCRLHFVKWSGSDTKQPNAQPAVSQQKRVDGKQTERCQGKGGDGIRQLNKNLLRKTVTCCYECGNELSDLTKGDYQFHVKDSDPRKRGREKDTGYVGSCVIPFRAAFLNRRTAARGPVNSFFIRREPGPNRFTPQYLTNFF